MQADDVLERDETYLADDFSVFGHHDATLCGVIPGVLLEGGTERVDYDGANGEGAGGD